MMVIVKRKDSPYKDGRFPSGSDWEDYILWCLIELGKECDREEAAKIGSAHKKAVAEKAGATEKDAGTGGEEQGEGGPPLDGIGASDSLSIRCRRMRRRTGIPIKVLQVWCRVFLLGRCGGHIPIIDSTGMQSDFFSDAKKKASFGRKTESRAAFRKMFIEQNAAAGGCQS